MCAAASSKAKRRARIALHQHIQPNQVVVDLVVGLPFPFDRTDHSGTLWEPDRRVVMRVSAVSAPLRPLTVIVEATSGCRVYDYVGRREKLTVVPRD